MPRELIIYCDESSSRGRHFSDFYGGALVDSDHIDAVRSRIAAKKKELNLHGEIKWTKITENYVDKYIEIVDLVFELISRGMLKLRIMFTQNTIVPKGLSQEHVEQTYFILYYQFIKHAFGLAHIPTERESTNIRVYLDKMPDKDANVSRFRDYIAGLSRSEEFRQANLIIRRENVTEVRSHEHDVLQCLDIVLGAINFRLNDKHLEKPPGSRRRAKRTKAKEKVYRRISEHVRATHPHFNIGISTGVRGDPSNRWNDGYRHWLFVPASSERLPGSKRKGPAAAT
jgi:hypothetical protein